MIKKKIHTLLIAIACLFLMQVTVTVSADDSTLQTESTTETTQEQSEDNETQSDSKKTESPIIDTENNNKEKDGSEETTDSENNNTEPEEKSFSDSNIRYFDDPIFKRELNNEPGYIIWSINNEYIHLTIPEFEEVETLISKNSKLEEKSIDFISELKKTIEYVILKGNHSSIQRVSRSTSSDLSHDEDLKWGTWQRYSSAYSVKNYPLKVDSVLNQPPAGIVDNLSPHFITMRAQVTFPSDGDTVPIYEPKKIEFQSPLIAKDRPVTKPLWWIDKPTEISYYTDYERTSTYKLKSFFRNSTTANINRKSSLYGVNFGVYLNSNTYKSINIQPEKKTTIGFNTENKYDLNYYKSDSLRSVPSEFVTGVKTPKVIKELHYDVENNKKIESLKTHGKKYGDKVTLRAKTNQNLQNYEFDSYKVFKNGKETGKNNSLEWTGKVNLDKTAVVFYYKPKPKEYTVSFNSNGGSAISTQIVKEGEVAKKPQNPKFENKNFIGWYEDKDLTTKYNFENPVNKDITLFAKWESPIVDPEDGDTPITPLDPENQNKTKDGLRIQYVSDFEFGEKKNEFRKEISGHAAGDIVKQNSKEKTVPAFVSVIDDRTLHSNEYQWELRAKSEPFKDTKDETTIDNASILLSDLNYARNLNKKPYAANNTLNISADSQLLSHNGDTKGGTWSLAFGQLENGKSTGVTIKIPAATAKKNVDYYAIINWELTPSLGGR